jgi:HD-GYP domain-containing protein (c-di-GMP phosphodiesterase class II)
MAQETEKQKVDTRDLQLGMYVSELDRPWIESPFIFQGFLITNDEELAQLSQSCNYVYVDITKSKVEVPARLVMSSTTKKAPFPKKKAAPIEVPFEKEFTRARAIYVDAIDTVSNILTDLRTGKLFSIKDIKETVIEITGSIMRNPDAMMLLTQIEAQDKAASNHALNVCILSTAFGRYLGMDEKELYELSLGAMLHDVGETQIPDGLMDKQDNYSTEELNLMQSHTMKGGEILSGLDDIPDSAITIALSHHERANGSGYPKRLVNDQISTLAKIVSITDVYDSVTSGTSREAPISATDALKSMYDWRNELFDGELIELFIQSLGIYPIGSVVQLRSDEIGIVISTSAERRLSPTLLLVLDSNKVPYQPPTIINLSQYIDDESKKYEITNVVDAEDYSIDKTSYIMRQLYA